VWLLYSRAKRFQVLPSSLLHLHDSYTAFCLDEAVDYFGTWVEGQLDKVPRGKKESSESHSAKRHARLVQLVTPQKKEGEKKDDKKAFAVPVAKRWKGGKSG
jgi:hypothetical protein